MSYKEQSTSSSSSVCHEARADVATDATTLAADNTSGCSNNKVDDDVAHESPLIRMKRGPSPTSLPSSTKKQQSVSDVDSIVKDVVKNSSSHQEHMMSLQEKMDYKKKREERKRLAEENREKEMDMKQQKLDMDHEKHKAALDAQQASQQVNMKMLDFLATLTTKVLGENKKEDK